MATKKTDERTTQELDAQVKADQTRARATAKTAKAEEATAEGAAADGPTVKVTRYLSPGSETVVTEDAGVAPTEPHVVEYREVFVGTDKAASDQWIAERTAEVRAAHPAAGAPDVTYADAWLGEDAVAGTRVVIRWEFVEE